MFALGLGEAREEACLLLLPNPWLSLRYHLRLCDFLQEAYCEQRSLSGASPLQTCNCLLDAPDELRAHV